MTSRHCHYWVMQYIKNRIMTNTLAWNNKCSQPLQERKWKFGILFWDSIERHYTAQQIRLNAQLLSVNKIQHEFRHHFVPEYQRGTGERDRTLLAGRSAEFIIKKLQLIAKNLQNPKLVSQVNKAWSITRFYLKHVYQSHLHCPCTCFVFYILQFLYKFNVITSII